MPKKRLSKPMDKEFFRRTDTMRKKIVSQGKRLDQYRIDYGVLQELSDYREKVIIDLRRQLNKEERTK